MEGPVGGQGGILVSSIPGLDAFEFIGRGANATVYRARQGGLRRNVAVKIITSSTDDGSEIPTEALAQALVSWHTNVVSLYASGRTETGSTYLILELAEGGSLEDRVRRSGPLGAVDLVRTGHEMASALAAAHAQGVVHCDVKPSNVLFARDGSSRLADFGIARTSGQHTPTLEKLGGSVMFAPPELLEGARPAAPNDVYGIGLSLWFAATGSLPFEMHEQSIAALSARIHAGGVSFASVEGAASLGTSTLRLLDRCLATEPQDRPTASELASELASALAAVPGPTSTPSDTAERAHRPRRPSRRRSIVNGSMVLLTVAVFATLLATSRTLSDADSGPDMCAIYTRSVTEREELITAISTDLERSASPQRVVERLLVTYPRRIAAILEPLLAAAATRSTIAATTTEQLGQLAVAEALRSLGGGKPFLFDGQHGEFEPSLLPADLRAPANAVSAAHRIAATECGETTVDLLGAKARMNSAIRSNLADPQFLSTFFSDPASYRLLSTESILLMANTVRPFVGILLDGHWDWLFELLSRNSDARSALAFEHPDLFLDAVREEPSLADQLASPEWLAELRIGLDRLAPAERVGVDAVFGIELAKIGATD